METKEKKEIAKSYFNDVVDGKLVYVSKNVTWFREFINLCKKAQQPIYVNFNVEYSIYPTRLFNEVKLN